MGAYIEWLKRCVDGMSQMRSISSEGVSMYGQALLWQFLFLLTIVGTVLAVGAVTGGPFVGIVAAVKGIKKHGLKKMIEQFPIAVNKTSSEKLSWSFISADQECSVGKMYISGVKKMYGVLLGFVGLLQFLFLPFGVTIGAEGNPVFCNVIGVFYWVITGITIIAETISACSEQQSLLWNIATTAFDFTEYYCGTIGEGNFEVSVPYGQDGNKLLIYLYSENGAEKETLKSKADEIAKRIPKGIAGKTAPEIKTLIDEAVKEVIK